MHNLYSFINKICLSARCFSAAIINNDGGNRDDRHDYDDRNYFAVLLRR